MSDVFVLKKKRKRKPLKAPKPKKNPKKMATTATTNPGGFSDLLWIDFDRWESFQDPVWSPIAPIVQTPNGLCDIFDRGACEFGLLNHETRRWVLVERNGETTCKPYYTPECRLKCSLHDCVDTMEFLDSACKVRFAFRDVLVGLLERLKREHALPLDSYRFFKRCRQQVFKAVNSAYRRDRRTKTRLDAFRDRRKATRRLDARRTLGELVKN